MVRPLFNPWYVPGGVTIEAAHFDCQISDLELRELFGKIGGDRARVGSMVVLVRVKFCRVAYPERGYALVARDDGVVYRLDGGPATPGIPHDLVHFTVEDSL